MKLSPLPKILLAVAAVLIVAAAFYSSSAMRNGKELREWQLKLNAINQRQPILNALAVDLIEYSKKNPSIDPLLESIGLKQGKGATGTAPAGLTAPATRPATK